MRKYHFCPTLGGFWRSSAAALICPWIQSLISISIKLLHRLMKSIGLLLMVLLVPFVGASWTYPIAMLPDLTYQTGIITVFSSPMGGSMTSTYPYSFPMSTSSLNCSIGVYSIEYEQKSVSFGFRFYVTSLTASSLDLYCAVKNGGNPIRSLKISYLVSCSPYLDMNYVSYSFAATDTVRNSSILDMGCYLPCRSYITSVSYDPKTSPKGIVTLAGYEVNNVMGGTASNNYTGITLEAPSWNSNSFVLNITVYGPGTEVSFASLYFVAFQPANVNQINSRNLMYGTSTVGCAYHINSCGNSNSIGNSSYQTGDPYVVLTSSQQENTVFYGVYRLITTWTSSATQNMTFTSGTTSLSGSRISVPVTFTGNTNRDFNLAFSFLTLQTYYCPDVAPNRYYSYNNWQCVDSCAVIGQYANATRYCQLCDAICYQCSGTANSCTTCFNNQNRVISGTSCVCDIAGGFYSDGTSLVCPSCHYSCATCSGAGSSNCLTCETGWYRYQSSNICPCIIGYYDSGGASCTRCYYTCWTATCNGNAWNRCLTCNATQFRVITGSQSCGCLSGYYDDATNNETCKPCQYSCLTCNVLSTNCTSCSATNRRSLDIPTATCPCGPGYYDAGLAMCQPCHVTCFTCNGPLNNNCQGCLASVFRTLNGSICQCTTGYYELSNVCVTCHYSCLACTTGFTNGCQTCSSTNLRTYNSTTSICDCNSGYYDSGSAVCTICNARCLNCSIAATNCTACHPLTARFLAGNTCLCATGYIDIYFNGTCTPCHYSCTSCSGTTTSCLTCQTGRTLIGTSCLCPGSTYDDGSSATCQPCASTCVNCTNSLTTTCTVCNPLLLRTLWPSPVGSCACDPGYYDSGVLVCTLCSSNCKTCLGTSTNCTSCDTAVNFRILSASYSCDCPTGYFNSGSLVVCQLCISTCLTCSLVPNNCTSCTPDRVLSSFTCNCLPGTFQNATGQCQVCAYTCLTCLGTSTNCTSCYTGSNRQQIGNSCPCLTGYYDASGINCLACAYSCGSCITGSTCQSCSSGSLRTLQTNMTCTCGLGYYDDGSSALCQPCYYKCRSCQFFSQCLTCNSLLYRIYDPVTQTCPCLTNYYDDGFSSTCRPCHYSCATCTGPSSGECTSCISTRIITSPSSCPCKVGFFEDGTICSPCSLACLTCSVASTNCTSCYAGSYLSSYQCICGPGYYLNGVICSPCDGSCQTCTLSATYCLACNPAYGTVLIGSSCACPAGKYPNSSNVCVNCDSTCLTCDSSGSTACLSCPTSVFRSYDAASKTCPCISGYFDGGVVLCQRCPSPCLTCLSGSTMNCTSCLSGYQLMGSSCRLIVTCPTNYYYMGYCLDSCPNVTYPSARTCLPCINYCKTCTTATHCTSCDNSLLLQPDFTCYGNCPSGTYAFQGICNVCPNNCSTCVYRTQLYCITCLTGFYLSGNMCTGDCPLSAQTHIAYQGKCLRCISPCNTCINLTSEACITCLSGYIFYLGSCLSTCPQGYFLVNSQCQTCPTRCLTCLNNECLACKPGFYLSLTGSCVSHGFFVSGTEEKECHPNCRTCTDRSFSSCIACSPYRGDHSQMAVSGYCDCWQGSVDLGDGSCDRESYSSLQKATSTLISATSAVTYAATLTGILSLNMMGPVLGLYYQQEYGNLCFLNASAVGQTDLVLDQYSRSSPNTYLKSIKRTNVNNYRLLHPQRQLGTYTNVQSAESLFMRGNKWQYLWDWAMPSSLGIAAVWVLGWVLECLLFCLRKKKKQQTKAYKMVNMFWSFCRDSALILLHLLTINEISVYSIASFKILIAMSLEINYTKLGLSLAIVAYYLLYLVRLVYACNKWEGTREENKKFMIMWACFEKHKKKILWSRLYVPILFIRALLMGFVLVVLSFAPIAQIVGCLVVFAVWALYSLLYCPYYFFIKVFIRIYELLYLLQLIVLSISVLKPEASRMEPAIVLHILNYFQVASLAGFSLSIFLANFYDVKCLKREDNIVANAGEEDDQEAEEPQQKEKQKPGQSESIERGTKRRSQRNRQPSSKTDSEKIQRDSNSSHIKLADQTLPNMPDNQLEAVEEAFQEHQPEPAFMPQSDLPKRKRYRVRRNHVRRQIDIETP